MTPAPEQKGYYVARSKYDKSDMKKRMQKQYGKRRR